MFIKFSLNNFKNKNSSNWEQLFYKYAAYSFINDSASSQSVVILEVPNYIEETIELATIWLDGVCEYSDLLIHQSEHLVDLVTEQNIFFILYVENGSFFIVKLIMHHTTS